VREIRNLGNDVIDQSALTLDGVGANKLTNHHQRQQQLTTIGQVPIVQLNKIIILLNSHQMVS
jgi:hypothetical protein